jgi:hypothetical protein
VAHSKMKSIEEKQMMAMMETWGIKAPVKPASVT